MRKLPLNLTSKVSPASIRMTRVVSHQLIPVMGTGMAIVKVAIVRLAAKIPTSPKTGMALATRHPVGKIRKVRKTITAVKAQATRPLVAKIPKVPKTIMAVTAQDLVEMVETALEGAAETTKSIGCVTNSHKKSPRLRGGFYLWPRL